MRIKHPLLLGGIGRLGAALTRCWMGTLRQTTSFDQWCVDPRLVREGFIYTAWHDALLTCTHDGRDQGVRAMISQSGDGEIASRIVAHLGFQPIRGSSTRGSLRAVRGMQRMAERAKMAITVDGPRGPRRVFQPGAVYLASRTGLPIVPLGVAYSRVWRAKSWDKFAVPLPFSHVALQFGVPLSVPGEIGAKELADYCQQAQVAMDEAERRAEQLLAGPRLPRTGRTASHSIQHPVETAPSDDRGASRAA